jgi:hypothetical protein
MTIRILIAVLTLPALSAFAAEPAKSLLPDLPTTAVSVPWKDFKALLEAGVKPEPKKDVKPKPPTDWSVTAASYEAELLPTGAVKVDASFDVTVWKTDGWTTIPLLDTSAATASVELDGEPAALAVLKDTWASLVLEKHGTHKVKLSFFVNTEPKEGVSGFRFFAVRAPITRMHLTLPIAKATIVPDHAATISTTHTDTTTEAELVFRSAEHIGVNWRLPTRPKPVQPKLTKAAKPVVPPQFTTAVSTLAKVTERFITCDATVEYSLLRAASNKYGAVTGTLDTFQLELPTVANVLQVNGEGLEWRQKAVDGMHRIDARLNHGVRERYTIHVRYELPIGNDVSTVEIPAVRALDAVRQQGALGVATQDNVEITPSPEIKDLRRIDSAELPPLLLRQARTPLLLAYRFTDPEHTMAIDVRRLADVAVRQSAIDRAEITTVLTEDNVTVTRATYAVRNNIKQHLRVDIGRHAEVWSAEVGGRVVKPAKDEKSGAILIPLHKSGGSGRALEAFPVSLVYSDALADAPGLFGESTLRTPATDIAVNEATWQVFVPDTRSYWRAEGDFRPITARTRRPDGAGRTATRGGKNEALLEIPRMREGMERFLITDLNNMVGAEPGGGATREVRAYRTRRQAPQAEDVATAGVLPVRARLPLSGKPVTFGRVLMPNDTPMLLTLHTYDARLAPVVGTAAFVVGLGLGLGLLSLVFGTRRRFITCIFLAVGCALLAAAHFGLGTEHAVYGTGFALGMAGGLVSRLSRRSVQAATPAPKTVEA